MKCRIVTALALVLAFAAPVMAQSSVSATNTISVNGGTVEITNARAMATAGFTVLGTGMTGTLRLQCSIDGTNYVSTGLTLTPIPTGSTVTSVTGDGAWSAALTACTKVRVVATSWNAGSAVVTLNVSEAGAGGGGTAITGSITAGAQPASDPHFVKCSDGSVANPCQVVLTTGTAAIGTLGANSGVDIGDVDVTSVVPGVGATNLGKTEDAAHTSGDVGVMVLGVRNDAGTTLAGTTGDYIPFSIDSSGALRVVGSSGTTQYAEDAAHASGDSMVIPGCVRRDTTPSVSSGTAGDYSTCNVDANGRLYTNSTLYASDGSALVQDTQGQHDTALGTITSVTGGVPMARASAAAPSDVSADGDAVIPWHLRSGAAAIQQTFAGVLASTGVGAAGTGTARVVDVASGTTGLAPPTQASYLGFNTSGATGGLLTGGIFCDSQGYLDMTTATTTEIAPLVSGRTIYICQISALASGTTVMTFKRGTGTNCGTGTNSISPAWDMVTSLGFTEGNGMGVVLGPVGAGTVGGGTTSGNAVCVTSSANVNLHVKIRYAVF